MISKLLIYVLIIPFVIWVLDSLNLNSIFKKNKIIQARIFYILITLVLSYLLVNFLYDFLGASTIY